VATARSPLQQPDSRPVRPRLAAGVRLIVVYKWVKSLLQLALAITLVVLILAGLADHLHTVAIALREHVVSIWSIRLADLLVTVTTHRHLSMTALALALDGVFSFVEGWSLWRGYAWGPWLVVVATGSFIPFELRQLLRQIRLGRCLVLVVNLVIVAYLVRRTRRESEAARLAR
jgi:uncharacterized membrane protein (DUF2068 family)